MDVSSYTSNIQPNGSQSGIKIASENDSAQRVSASKEGKNASEINAKRTESMEASIELAKQREKLNQADREKMVEEMNDFISSINKGLSFRVDEESGRDVVTIYEASTGDIIRQIPDEEMLEVLRRLREQTSRQASGLFNIKV